MFNSVRSRLTVWYAAVLTCSLLLLSLVIYFIVKESVFARMDAGLVELSDSFLATLEAELKDAVKAAMVEVLVEQRTLVREIIEEVIEDIAMSRAIDDGLRTPAASREEVFSALDSQ